MFFLLYNLKYFLCFIFVFSILFTPFFYFFLTAETDYLERIFYMDFDIEKKKVLLSESPRSVLYVRTVCTIGLQKQKPTAPPQTQSYRLSF